jgi:hypothetical protein
MIAAAAPPADSPATYTREGSTAKLFITCRVMPAIRAGSPRPLCWSSGRNQFQQREPFAAAGCSGYTAIHVSSSACAFIRVPAAKSSAFCLQPCSITTIGTGSPQYRLGT